MQFCIRIFADDICSGKQLEPIFGFIAFLKGDLPIDRSTEILFDIFPPKKMKCADAHEMTVS